MSLETSITDLVDATNALTDTVNNKIATIDAEIQVLKDAYIAAVVASNSAINMLSDSGRFDGGAGIRGTASGIFANHLFFSTYNGSVSSDGGKFINDNSTNGGSAGVLVPDVVSLLTALGRTASAEMRYGIEFYLNKITAGGGAVNPVIGPDSITRFLLLSSAALNFMSSQRGTSLSMMVKVLSGSVHFNTSVYPFPDVVLDQNSGWSRVVIYGKTKIGYDNGFIRAYAAPGSIVLLALPILYLGNAQVFNTAPSPTS